MEFSIVNKYQADKAVFFKIAESKENSLKKNPSITVYIEP